MSRWNLLACALFSNAAFATEVKINAADGQHAVVLIDEYVKGETPVTTEVDGGEVTLAFRDSMFGPVLFSETITVPADGSVTYIVNVEERTVERKGDSGSSTSSTKAETPNKEEAEPESAVATKLTITSSEKGAMITLDGKSTGKKTPATFDVDPGRHSVEVASGCLVGSEDVSVKEGSTEDLTVDLVGAKVMVAVTSTPEGATISVDGKEVGKTPLDAKLTCGDRVLTATLEGYFDAEQEISLGTEDAKAKFSLEKATYGSIEVSVEPTDAVIFLDGKKMGKGTAELDKVATGEHVLTIERKGHELKRKEFTLKENAAMVLAFVVGDPPKGKPPAKQGSDTEPVAKQDKVAKPNKVKKARGKGPTPVRMIVNSAVTVAGIPFIALGAYNYSQARIAYDDYVKEPDNTRADKIFKDEVQPRQTLGFVEFGVGGALVATGAALWITSFMEDAPIVVLPTHNGFVVGGAFR